MPFSKNLVSANDHTIQVDDEVGFIKFFRGLPAKSEETIRIFDRTDYYTAHGDDAAFIARTVCLHFVELGSQINEVV